MPLTNISINRAKPTDSDWKLADANGLYLLVRPSGAKLWRFNYRFAGKQKTLTYGAYPTVSLQDARERHGNARKQLAAGVDPGGARKAAAEAEAAVERVRFGAILDAFQTDLRERGRLAEKTLFKKNWILEEYVRPALGDRPAPEVRPSEILAVLRKIERLGFLETARRCRQLVSEVYRFAMLKDLCIADPTVALKGETEAPNVRHHPAIIHEASFGKLLRAIETYLSPNTRLALLYLSETFVRPVEMRLATWSEIDLEDAIWRIPASRMKMGRPFDVPLTAGARRILKQISDINGTEGLIFPSPHDTPKRPEDRSPMSENTLNQALGRLGYKDKHSAHGFRSSASTILNTRKFREDVIEFQLAHFEEGSVRKVYNRAEYWEERVEMMAAWSDLIGDLKAANVT